MKIPPLKSARRDLARGDNEKMFMNKCGVLIGKSLFLGITFGGYGPFFFTKWAQTRPFWTKLSAKSSPGRARQAEQAQKPRKSLFLLVFVDVRLEIRIQMVYQK